MKGDVADYRGRYNGETGGDRRLLGGVTVRPCAVQLTVLGGGSALTL